VTSFPIIAALNAGFELINIIVRFC